MNAVEVADADQRGAEILRVSASWLKTSSMAGDSNFEIQFHPVVAKLHVWRQAGIGCLVRQVVGNVVKNARVVYPVYERSELPIANVWDGAYGEGASRKRTSRFCS